MVINLIREIVQDFAVLEDSKIVQDDDKFLVVKAVIASETVHKYKDGMAYKPADELEKAAWTAEGRWVKALSHPTSDHIRNVNDINGRMENPRFRKDLNDFFAFSLAPATRLQPQQRPPQQLR